MFLNLENRKISINTFRNPMSKVSTQKYLLSVINTTETLTATIDDTELLPQILKDKLLLQVQRLIKKEAYLMSKFHTTLAIIAFITVYTTIYFLT